MMELTREFLTQEAIPSSRIPGSECVNHPILIVRGGGQNGAVVDGEPEKGLPGLDSEVGRRRLCLVGMFTCRLCGFFFARHYCAFYWWLLSDRGGCVWVCLSTGLK